MSHETQRVDGARLANSIKQWGRELGFDAVGITGVELGEAESRLMAWLARGRHGEMDYMARHGAKRARPAELVPGTASVISARMNHWPAASSAEATLADPRRAYVARYALGRDYHKVLRKRLANLARRMQREAGGCAWRVFADSAPVMEVEIAVRAGIGWRGKHTLLLDREAGSHFFLGEIYTDLALPSDPPQTDHCGSCRRCIDACPTGAILAPYELDARRCISYLTIESKGAIPGEMRPRIGNRIYGCDDCQLVCPWNRFARVSPEPDFAVRNRLDEAQLVELLGWSESEFRERMAGSAVMRIGYQRWLRNVAVALGNAPPSERIVSALNSRLGDCSELAREHVLWALARQRGTH